MSRYNVAYDAPDGTRLYCMQSMDHSEAERQLQAFKWRYMNADGTPKTYPNGKGCYDIQNPRIVLVKS